MSRRVIVACAVILWCAGGAAAQQVGVTQIFPGVARTAGAGVPPT